MHQLVKRFGEHRNNTAPGFDRFFPQPNQLVDAPLEEIGTSKSQASSLRSLALAVLEGKFDFRRGQLLDEFVSRATAIAGINSWIAHYVAMRALNHPDAFPIEDQIIQSTLRNGKQPSAQETHARSQQWRPWRAYAAVHLWRYYNRTVG